MPQIDAGKLNEYADIVFSRCNSFNDYTLEVIGKRIKAIGRLSAADQIALKNIADVSGDIKAITNKLAEITEQNVKDIEAIYTKVVTDGVNSYQPLYDFKGIPFIPFEQNKYAQFLVWHWAEQTAEQMINLSQTKALCFEKYNLEGEVIGSAPLEGAFQKAIDDAVIAVSTGATDFNTAMRKTVENLGGSGVKVAYGSGVNRSFSGMVRQNLLYGAKQSAQAYDRYVGEKLGCDGFEVDYHPHPRPSHEFMGGKMYSYSGTVRIGGRIYEDGTEALARLGDYGCLHFKTDVILGVSNPRYDEKWLEEQKVEDKELIEYNGVKKTKYEWQQGARRLEAETRRQRDIAYMAKASGDKTLERKAKEKIAFYRKGYDDLCGKVGLEKRYNRMATYPVKSVDNVGKSGIMKVQGGKIMNINNVESPIEQRNTAKGNPNAILQFDRPLNNRQQKLLNSLLEYDSKVIIKKKDVNMRDLAALTAVTGDEFALFTKGSERLVVRGNANSVNIDIEKANELSKQGYKWSGHTHPGVDKNSLMASIGDKEILKCFKQKVGYIYNSKGEFLDFWKE